MDDNTKKALLIGLVVAAVIAAAFSGFKSMQGEQGKAGAYFGDPKGKPPKQMEMEAAKAAQDRAAQGAPSVDSGGRTESPGN